MPFPSGFRPARAFRPLALAALLTGLGGVGLGAALVAMAAPGIELANSPWGSRDPAGEAGPELRVLLQQGDQLEPAAPTGPLRVLDSQGRPLALLTTGEQLRIRRDANGLRLDRSGAGDLQASNQPGGQPASLRVPLQDLWIEAVPATGPVARLMAAVSPGGPVLGLGRRRYRGRLQIRPEGNQLMAVNHLPLEVYLPSVVGSEMPARWPAAALRAQAVAARTYALAQLKPGAPFDLKATVASQAYLGLEAETDSTRSAVAATRSQVLRHGGALIDAVFHSSSGGSTENSGELWNRQLPYLVSVPDQDTLSPWHHWNVRFEPEQLQRAFRETGGASRIDVLTASSTGRVRRARVIGPAGSLDLTGGELRQRLGLRSTLVEFRFEGPLAPGPAGGITTATARANAEAAALNRYGGRGADGQERSADTGFRGGNGAPAGPSSAGLAAGAPPPPPPPVPGDALQANRQEPLTATLPALEVVGRGFGHGVGMSQWGAYGLALQGVSYEQILRHYYRGAQLVAYPAR